MASGAPGAWKNAWGIDRPRAKRLISYRPTLEAFEERVLPAAGLQEQYLLELVNNMRTNPAATLPLILNSTDPDVQAGLAFFAVDPTLLTQQWASLGPVQPLAWNDALASAAVGHSQAMAQSDIQAHQVPGEATFPDRIEQAGYQPNTYLAENVYAYGKSLFHTHAAFAVDWGNGPGGIQSPPGHREDMMDNSMAEMGIGLVAGLPGHQTGPLLVTEDFGNRLDIVNPFLVGVAYRDTDGDELYSQGEGLANVTVVISGASRNFNTVTTAAGGYQLQLPSGDYQVTFTGGTLTGPIVQAVHVGVLNAKVDAKVGATNVLSFAAPTVNATNNAGTVSLVVTRTGDVSGAVSVNFATGSGSAEAGTDYVPAAGALTFNSGETQKSITISILPGNGTHPVDVPLVLSDPQSGAVLGLATTQIHIIDPASPGVLQFASMVFRAAEDAGTATVTVIRQDGAAGAASVQYATSDGTAMAGKDYTSASDTLSFADGETSKTFTIAFNDDGYVVNGKKTINLKLSDSSGASLGSLAEARIDVLDTDNLRNHRFVAIAFWDVLGRQVDENTANSVWAGQLDGGISRSTFVNMIDHSDEYFGNIITPAYSKFLGRNPDSSGLQYWIARMHAGLTDQQLEAAFIGSPEYYQFTGGADSTWVKAMYQNLLGRQPDAPGLAYWLDRLAHGAVRDEVALGFAASAEREGMAVQELYARYLGRSAGDSEVAFWVASFKTGTTSEQIITGFVGSDEYFQMNVL
jgi:uncharacterized protein YkwD